MVPATCSSHTSSGCFYPVEDRWKTTGLAVIVTYLHFTTIDYRPREFVFVRHTIIVTNENDSSVICIVQINPGFHTPVCSDIYAGTNCARFQEISASIKLNTVSHFTSSTASGCTSCSEVQTVAAGISQVTVETPVSFSSGCANVSWQVVYWAERKG